MSTEPSMSSLGSAERERDAARAFGPPLSSPELRSGPTRIPVAPFAALARVYAIFVKELIQLRRDRVTFATMIFIPLVQLMLFGYAINTDPKHLPTAVLIQDDSVFTRSFMAALRTSEYFDVRTVAQGEADLDHLILSGVVQFGVQIPANFGRDLIRGEKPSILGIVLDGEAVAHCLLRKAKDPCPVLRLSEHLEGVDGKAMFRHACA